MLDIIFFFSSRRRHTRWNCDWSSDVCSSDLTDFRTDPITGDQGHAMRGQTASIVAAARCYPFLCGAGRTAEQPLRNPGARSEERRVGKECRAWRVRNHKRKIKIQIADN